MSLLAGLSSLGLGDTDGLAVSAGRLGVLTAHLQAPVVAETSVEAHLLHHLEVLSHLGVQDVGDSLEVLAVLDVFLSVEEPVGDVVLAGVGEDLLDLLDLLSSQLTSSKDK